MAAVVTGFQGTISDAAMALQFPNHGPVVSGIADLAVSAVGGARSVVCAAGSALAGFIRYTDTAVSAALALAAPASGGKWYAITINRQWSPTSTAVLQADDLGVSDTNGAIPIAPLPAAVSAAAALPNQPGTAGSTAGQRQVLALVYVRAADTTLTIFDLRMIATGLGVVVGASLAALQLFVLRRAVPADTTVTCADGITYRWNGASWLPWDSDWTPYTCTVSGLAGSKDASPGWIVRRSEYRWVSGKVHARISYLVNNGSANGQQYVSLPVSAFVPNVGAALRILQDVWLTRGNGTQVVLPSAVGGAGYNNLLFLNTFTAANGTVGPTSGTAPVSWTGGDQVDIEIAYDPA